MRRQGSVLLTFLTAALVLAANGQVATKDIKEVFAEGKVTNGQYRNDYFGVTLTPVGAQFTEGGFVSPSGNRARLIDAQANAANWDDKYEFAILADARSANPLITSPEQYVRSVRHNLEKEGFVTVQAEAPLQISGVPFVFATMKVADQGRNHYRGIYTTFRNGYILSLDVSAPSLARLQGLLTLVKFKAP